MPSVGTKLPVDDVLVCTVLGMLLSTLRLPYQRRNKFNVHCTYNLVWIQIVRPQYFMLQNDRYSIYHLIL